MSRTLRLKGYRKGKPVLTNDGKVRYGWLRHELPEVRRWLNKSRRLKQKQYFKRFGEVPYIQKTNGWFTW